MASSCIVRQAAGFKLCRLQAADCSQRGDVTRGSGEVRSVGGGLGMLAGRLAATRSRRRAWRGIDVPVADTRALVGDRQVATWTAAVERIQMKWRVGCAAVGTGSGRAGKERTGGRAVPDDEDAEDWEDEDLEGQEADMEEVELDDQELDALFESEGELLYTNEEALLLNDLDDTDSCAFALEMAAAANDVKAADILVLRVSPLVYWTRVMVLVTAFSRPQISAIEKHVRDASEQNHNRKTLNNSDVISSWTLMDYGDVVVHIMLPRDRQYYSLEEFYKEAEVVPLPFETRSMM